MCFLLTWNCLLTSTEHFKVSNLKRSWNERTLSCVYPPPRLNLLNFSMRALSTSPPLSPFAESIGCPPLFLLLSPLCHWDKVSAWSRISLSDVSLVWCSARSRDPTVPTAALSFQEWGSGCLRPHLPLCLGAGELNSRPHACAARTPILWAPPLRGWYIWK